MESGVEEGGETIEAKQGRGARTTVSETPAEQAWGPAVRAPASTIMPGSVIHL